MYYVSPYGVYKTKGKQHFITKSKGTAFARFSKRNTNLNNTKTSIRTL